MHLYLAEALGTLLLILFGNGVVANVLLARTKGQGGGLIAVTAGWGFAVAIGAYAVGRVSGAHLNPAVTLALACFGGFSWSLVPGYILAQLAGAFLGSALVDLTYAAHWAPTADPLAKLSCHCTTPAIRNFPAAFVTEVIGTAVLVLGVELLGRVGVGAQPGQEAWVGALGTWFGPALVGLLVFAIGLSLGGPTGYAINPARDFGPRIAHALLPIPGKGSSDWSYAWIPVAGPLAGGLIGAGMFKLLGL